jgi:hypothetical protein
VSPREIIAIIYLVIGVLSLIEFLVKCDEKLGLLGIYVGVVTILLWPIYWWFGFTAWLDERRRRARGL